MVLAKILHTELAQSFFWPTIKIKRRGRGEEREREKGGGGGGEVG